MTWIFTLLCHSVLFFDLWALVQALIVDMAKFGLDSGLHEIILDVICILQTLFQHVNCLFEDHI